MKIRDIIDNFTYREETDTQLISARISSRKKRKKLRKDWKLSGMASASRAGYERAIRKIVRREVNRDKPNIRLTRDEQLLLLRDKRESILLDRLFPRRNSLGGWKRLRDRDMPTSEQVIDLKDFSFLNNPQATIHGLKDIARAEALSPGAKINFCDKYCLDVSPFMLLVECWGEMLPIFEGGRMEIPMQKVLSAVGIQEAMGIGLNGVEEYSNIWAFPLYRRRKQGRTMSRQPYLDAQTREFASDRFCDALNQWLARPEIGLYFNTMGRGWVKDLIGELLENAERHSDGERRDGTWGISGFMARRQDEDSGQWIYRAHIGIVSLGDTFSESLERAHPDQLSDINSYVTNMRHKGSPQSDETLRTLAALQDGVTCFREADEDGRGGFGLMEMLDLVCMLGGTDISEHQPKVTIVSGSSCIRLFGPYIRGERTEGSNDPRVQWCNSENSSTELPSEAHVFDLKPGIPGTTISIGLTLDPNYLQEIMKVGA